MIRNCLLAKCDKCRISLTKKGKQVETPVLESMEEVNKAIRDNGWLYEVTEVFPPVVLCSTCRTGG